MLCYVRMLISFSSSFLRFVASVFAFHSFAAMISDFPFVSLFSFFFFDVRLLDVCQGQYERDQRQLTIFLVFEHLEEDLAGYLHRMGRSNLPARTIQVCYIGLGISIYIMCCDNFVQFMNAFVVE